MCSWVLCTKYSIYTCWLTQPCLLFLLHFFFLLYKDARITWLMHNCELFYCRDLLLTSIFFFQHLIEFISVTDDYWAKCAMCLGIILSLIKKGSQLDVLSFPIKPDCLPLCFERLGWDSGGKSSKRECTNLTSHLTSPEWFLCCTVRYF